MICIIQKMTRVLSLVIIIVTYLIGTSLGCTCRRESIFDKLSRAEYVVHSKVLDNGKNVDSVYNITTYDTLQSKLKSNNVLVWPSQVDQIHMYSGTHSCGVTLIKGYQYIISGRYRYRDDLKKYEMTTMLCDLAIRYN